jgi:hypothetical protein
MSLLTQQVSLKEDGDGARVSMHGDVSPWVQPTNGSDVLRCRPNGAVDVGWYSVVDKHRVLQVNTHNIYSSGSKFCYDGELHVLLLTLSLTQHPRKGVGG